MSWKPTPKWADARTLRWVADQIEPIRDDQAETARVFDNAPGAESIHHGARGWAEGLGTVVRQLRNRATRLERSNRARRGKRKGAGR